MLCPKCNYRNPGTMAYCQKCGGRMDFTADQIAGSLVETAHQRSTMLGVDPSFSDGSARTARS